MKDLKVVQTRDPSPAEKAIDREIDLLNRINKGHLIPVREGWTEHENYLLQRLDARLAKGEDGQYLIACRDYTAKIVMLMNDRYQLTISPPELDKYMAQLKELTTKILLAMRDRFELNVNHRRRN